MSGSFDVAACPDMGDEVPNLFRLHLPQFVQGEVPLLKFLEDLLADPRVLSERSLEVPHLSFDGLGQFEDTSGQQRPVLSEDNLKEGPGYSSGIGDHVVLIRDKREGVDSTA